jgi:hypothetical protein
MGRNSTFAIIRAKESINAMTAAVANHRHLHGNNGTLVATWISEMAKRLAVSVAIGD